MFVPNVNINSEICKYKSDQDINDIYIYTYIYYTGVSHGVLTQIWFLCQYNFRYQAILFVAANEDLRLTHDRERQGHQ